MHGGARLPHYLAHDKKTLVVGEGARHEGSPCMPGGEMGIYTIDITNPKKPQPLGYGSVERSGHHVTAHPTKPFVYVSYGDVPATPNEKPEFEVWSIKNPAKPKYVSSGIVSGYHGPHDIAFNAKGTRAVASSMTAIQVLDTSDPTKPKEVQLLQCPGCSHNHEAHFTPDQKHVVVSDETTGGIASPCPLGALYFYGWNNSGPTYMDFVGQWQPDDAVLPDGAPTNVPLCTSHVFDISADGTKIVAAWHTGGVKVVDIRDMTGVGIGSQGDGAKEIAWYNSSGADSWSAKFHPSGEYVFVNDRVSGFEVYRLTPTSR